MLKKNQCFVRVTLRNARHFINLLQIWGFLLLLLYNQASPMKHHKTGPTGLQITSPWKHFAEKSVRQRIFMLLFCMKHQITNLPSDHACTSRRFLFGGSRQLWLPERLRVIIASFARHACNGKRLAKTCPPNLTASRATESAELHVWCGVNHSWEFNFTRHGRCLPVGWNVRSTHRPAVGRIGGATQCLVSVVHVEAQAIQILVDTSEPLSDWLTDWYKKNCCTFH